MIKYHLSKFNWEYLNSNDYNIDQKVEYFNNVLNKLFISHIPNINNIIKQVGPTSEEYIEIEEASKTFISKI